MNAEHPRNATDTTPDVNSAVQDVLRYDVVIVGAGPAGSSAAIVAARAGKRVLLIERGVTPGSKNMYGGVVYPRVLDSLIPNWWESMPVQRWVVRRSTMMLTPDHAVSVDIRANAWGEVPYNGATTLRPEFDQWLAQHAVDAGAELLCSTVVTGLLRSEHGQIIGVRTDRPDGDVFSSVVIAADGVNSFLAKEAGLYPHFDPSHFTLGVKEVRSLDRSTLEQRFSIRGTDGVDIEVLGCTGDVPGGGFIYTNADTIAVGLVLQLPALAASGKRPEELLRQFTSHAAIAPLLEDSELVEYSAHVIPEGGYDHMPTLAGAGMLVVGDAAAMCLAAGLWLEGVNFAIGSGIAAAETIIGTVDPSDGTALLKAYRKRLEQDFVLADHKRLRAIPELVLSQRVQHVYPTVAGRMLERIFTVTNPVPKDGLLKIAIQELRRSKTKFRHLLGDIWKGFRGLK